MLRESRAKKAPFLLQQTPISDGTMNASLPRTDRFGNRSLSLRAISNCGVVELYQSGDRRALNLKPGVVAFMLE